MKKQTLKSLKFLIAGLVPVLIGVVGCCLYTAALNSTIRWGKEGFIEGTIYMLGYGCFLLFVAIPIAICSVLYIWSFTRQLRCKAGLIFLFLFYLVLLVVTPHFAHAQMYSYVKTKIQKRLFLQREVRNLIDRKFQVGTNIDEVKTWLQREDIKFVYLEDTHEIIARIRDKRFLDSNAILVEFPVFIQFRFENGQSLKTCEAVSKHWSELYHELSLSFKRGTNERSTSHEKRQTRKE